MVQTMLKCGLHIECLITKSPPVAQCEIDQRFDTLGEVRGQYDALQVHHPQCRQSVRQDREPSCRSRCSAITAAACIRIRSIWKDGKPLFAGDGYAGLSQMALWYIGGLLKHARALSAIIAPTTNSYKRLVPGYEAPVNLAYSRRNRSAACRIPHVFGQPEGQAGGVPAAGSRGESVPGVFRHADGRVGRHSRQDRSGRTAGQGHLRSLAGGDEERALHAGIARRGAQPAWKTITPS